MKRIIYASIMLLAGFVLSCNNGGGGGSSSPVSTPENAKFDASGLWLMQTSLSSSSGPCSSAGMPGNDAGLSSITQSGNDFIVDDAYQGSVNGDDYVFVEEQDDQGVHAKTTVAFTLNSETSGSGTLTIEASKLGAVCTFTYNVSLKKQGLPSSLTLTSPAFSDGGTIPAKYACATFGGMNVSPPLAWTNLPTETKSMVVAVSDFTADDETHWVVYGISPLVTNIPEGIPVGDTVLDAQIPGGAKQLANDLGAIGYSGLCPTTGNRPHIYHFEIYALDTEITSAGSVDDLRNQMGTHVLAAARLKGSF